MHQRDEIWHRTVDNWDYLSPTKGIWVHLDSSTDMPMSTTFQLPYTDEKTKGYRLLEVNGIITVISNLFLFSDQEINWPVITKLVGNSTHENLQKSLSMFLAEFFSLLILHWFLWRISSISFWLMEECKYSSVIKTKLSWSFVKWS